MSVNLTSTFVVTFSGRSGSGSISVPGVKVGDYLVAYFVHPLGVNGVLGAWVSALPFEYSISVADQIQQSSTADLSSGTYDGIFIRSC